jgi:hypothetical protein
MIAFPNILLIDTNPIDTGREISKSHPQQILGLAKSHSLLVLSKAR